MSFFDPRTIVFGHWGSHVLIDENTVCVRKPTSYGEMPSTERPAWLLELGEDEVLGYWEGICYATERICCLNGVINRGEHGITSVRCSKCRHPCGDAYWLCPRCSKDVCEACYEESPASPCVEHGMIHVTTRSKLEYVCDVCQCEIRDVTWRHHENPPYQSIDICDDCEPTEEMADLIFDDDFSDPDRDGGVTRFDATGFGSMLDWIPVGRDAESGLVLVCLNPESPNYGHVAISRKDDHDRHGYFDLAIDLETFIARTEEHMAESGRPRANDFVRLWMENKQYPMHYF